jgi:hypothetical protein
MSIRLVSIFISAPGCMDVCSDLATSKSDPVCAPDDAMLLTRIGTSCLEILVIVVRFAAI